VPSMTQTVSSLKTTASASMVSSPISVPAEAT